MLGERLNIEASRLNRENVTKVDAKQEGFALGPKGCLRSGMEQGSPGRGVGYLPT